MVTVPVVLAIADRALVVRRHAAGAGLLLAASLPLLRSRGLSALPVTTSAKPRPLH